MICETTAVKNDNVSADRICAYCEDLPSVTLQRFETSGKGAVQIMINIIIVIVLMYLIGKGIIVHVC